MDRIIIPVSRSSAVISKTYRRLFAKITQVACFEVSSGDKVPLEENYEKKLGDTRIPKLRQETQHRRRRRVPEQFSHYSKLPFSFHNIVRPRMILRDGMLWCASQARQKGYSYRSRRVILTRNLRRTVGTCDSAPEAGDSKWEMARCNYMKGFYMSFDMAASSHSPLRIPSFYCRTTCSSWSSKVPGQNYVTSFLWRIPICRAWLAHHNMSPRKNMCGLTTL